MKNFKHYVLILFFVFVGLTVAAAPVFAADNEAAFDILGGYNILGGLAGYIISSLLLYMIAGKAGAKDHAWWAFIPVLNIFLILEMAEMPCLFIILLLIPIVNIFIAIFAWYNIILKLDKPGWHIIFMLIPGINFLYMVYLAL